MKIDKALVQKLAHLSKLEFTDEEIETFIPDFEEVVNYVNKINELDLDGIEPLRYVNEGYGLGREDKVEQPLPKEKVLNIAPKSDSDYYRVPKVID